MSENNGIFIGVDTSNYTTSIAAVDIDGRVLKNLKRLLPVKDGQRGLRQSDAVFAHVKALPEMIDEFFSDECIYGKKLLAVGCSSAPRNAAGSYMPCFLAGMTVSAALSVNAECEYLFSHQEGHIMAALYSANVTELAEERFIAFHVSGGTTDILEVMPSRENAFCITKIGGTLDLNAGQVIDRAGVMMGLSFPAGPHLERMAEEYKGKTLVGRLNVNGLECNLSGVENKAEEIYHNTGSKSECAAYVIKYIAETLSVLSRNIRETYPELKIVYAGGVMSCGYIKKRLSEYSGYFAEPEFSSDNAAGTALLARRRYMLDKGLAFK